MKIKAILLTLIALLICSTAILAQPKDKYNFTRAIEEAEKGNNADALDYLQKEVKKLLLSAKNF